MSNVFIAPVLVAHIVLVCVVVLVLAGLKGSCIFVVKTSLWCRDL